MRCIIRKIGDFPGTGSALQDKFKSIKDIKVKQALNNHKAKSLYEYENYTLIKCKQTPAFSTRKSDTGIQPVTLLIIICTNSYEYFSQ